jgi:hypothetical protein
MYNTNNSKEIRHYVKHARKKIKDIYKVGMTDRCIFIFPNDLKTKSLEDIFSSVLIKKELKEDIN